MALESYNDLNEVHIDVLREIGNIGSGSAASALSEMLAKTIDIAIPVIGIADYNVAYEALGGADSVMVGTILTISGHLSGMMLFLLPGSVACDLLNILMYTDISDCTEIDEMGFSAIGEMANIMSASFVKAISDMTGMTIDISPPSSTIDMLGSIMSVPAIYFAEMGDKLMYIKNDLKIDGRTAQANIMLLPDAQSLEDLMTRLGIEV